MRDIPLELVSYLTIARVDIGATIFFKLVFFIMKNENMDDLAV